MKIYSSKKLIQIILLSSALIFITKFFQSTPFEALFFQLQAVFLAIILLFLLLYIANAFIKQKPINKVVMYFLFLILFMPLYSAYRSHTEFGQSYLYGILSQRNWLLLGVGIWFYYGLMSKKIALTTVESSFLLLAWGSLIIFTLFALTFDPSQLTGDEKFARMTMGRGLRFQFQKFFITFGSLYYFIKYTRYKKTIDLLILFSFLSYVVFMIQGRIYMMILAVTFLFYYYFNYKLSKFILQIIKVILFLLVIILLMQIFVPEYVERMGNLFGQMFKVLGGQESNDASSNARIWTSRIVLDYFDLHPGSIWFGTGKVSNQWNGGYEALFGYFYPSDIGILGGTFLYGIFGMILLLIIPLILEIKEIRRTKQTDNLFIQTIKYMLILSIFKSLQGGLYFGANVWIILFFILFAYNMLKRRKNEET